MKRNIRFLAAALSAAALMSSISTTAFADTVKTVDGLKYRYSDSGESKGLFTGRLKKSNGDTYYYKNGEPLKNKWLKSGGVRTYYVDDNGRIVTGKCEIKGKTYLFGKNGKLVDDGGDEWHITSRIIELTTDYVEVAFTQHFNENGGEYFLYPSYYLEKKVNGKWERYEKELFDEKSWDDYLTEFDYPDEADGSGSSDSAVPTSAADAFFFPKTLETGTYRAVMSIGMFKGDEHKFKKYYVGFDITEKTPNKLGITLIPKNVTKTGMTVEIKQSGGRVYGELSGGLDFLLEKKTDKGWEKLPTVTDDWGFDDLGVLITKGESREMEVNWKYMYGSLKKGEYRIMKQFFDFVTPGSQNMINAYGYFTIK